MRALPLLVACLLSSACVGGQTGEITMLEACSEPRREVALDEASEAGESASAQLAQVTTSTRAEVRWQGWPESDIDSVTQLEVSFAIEGRATVMDGVEGGERCERPYLRVPAQLSLRTDDGRLDERVPGSAQLRPDGLVLVRGELPVASMRGDLPTGDAAGGSLSVSLQAEGDALTGELRLSSADEELGPSYLTPF